MRKFLDFLIWLVVIGDYMVNLEVTGLFNFYNWYFVLGETLFYKLLNLDEDASLSESWVFGVGDWIKLFTYYFIYYF
jgi:hypothetical protein